MRIKEIEMRNVKGQTAVQPLTGKDIIIGRNGAGKTTRMQTIGLAMLGYVPGKGKTAADTFKLASDDIMAVRMETEGFGFERQYSKSRKLKDDGTMDVKISQKMSVSPSMGETTNSQKEQRIRKEMGDFPSMLDFGSFIAMTDNQQRDFIYNLSGNGFSWNRDRVYDELRKKLLPLELEENNEDLYLCMTDCLDMAMAQYRDGIDVQSGILAVSEFAKDRLKYWKKEKITADSASRKLTELKNKGEETDRDLNLNLLKMKELQVKREQLIKDIAEIGAKNNTIKTQEEHLKSIREEIERLGNDQNTATEESLLKEIIEDFEKAIKDGEERAEQYESKGTALQNEMASLQDALKAENEKLMCAKEELALINAEIKANGDLLQRIQDSHGCCAFSPNIPCNQDFSEFIDKTQATMDSAYERKDEVENTIADADERIHNLQDKIQQTQTEQKMLNRDKTSLAKTIAEANKQIQLKNTELSKLQGREPMLVAKRQQEAEIAAYLAENAPVDLTLMEDQKSLVSGQIEALQAKIDEQKRVRNDLINIKANIIDSQTAEFQALCWNQISNAIGQKGIKGSIMKEMLNPMLEDVNAKLHEIGIEEDFFFETNSDTGKEIFEFGWTGKPFAALSTGEQLLLMTALMTCMIERANPPVKVLAIDNINDLDRQNLSLVMRGLGTIGKNLDNIILAGVVEPTEEDSEGWTIWRL